MKALKTFLQFGLWLLALPVVSIFYLLRKYIVVEFVLPNVTLFGHLALEPEKVLSNIATHGPRPVGEPKRVLIWSLGKSKDQVNKALVKIWRRELFVLPSAIVDAMHRASKWLPNFEMRVLQFDKLHENDHVLDSCESHLKFTSSEVKIGVSICVMSELSRRSHIYVSSCVKPLGRHQLPALHQVAHCEVDRSKTFCWRQILLPTWALLSSNLVPQGHLRPMAQK